MPGAISNDAAGSALARRRNGSNNEFPTMPRSTTALRMNFGSIAIVLLLLTIANGSPVVAKRVLGDRWAWPVDGDARFIDGQPLFGHSKTIRGLVVASRWAFATPLIGLDWRSGATHRFGVDVRRSLFQFHQRRMGMAPSSRAAGLDQIPESLFPALLAMRLMASPRRRHGDHDPVRCRRADRVAGLSNAQNSRPAVLNAIIRRRTGDGA